MSDPVQFSIYPLELVRTRLAVCPMGTYRGIWDCWRQIVRKEGWACFYRGLTPSLVGCSFISTLSESWMSAGAPVPARTDFLAEELALQIIYYEDSAPLLASAGLGSVPQRLPGYGALSGSLS